PAARAASAGAARWESSSCVPSASGSWPSAARSPACARPAGKGRTPRMNLTDPVADMLTRVRNACQAGHRRVDMPVSKLKVEIARLLRDNHYIQDFKVH